MTDPRSSVASILWQTKVGSLQSRSSIIVDNDHVYVGTCGDDWNVRDRHDGVHCLALESGEERWFTPTLADVNEMAVAGTELIVPTDSGDVLILDRESGAIQRILRADSGVLGKPIVLRMMGGWSALFASINGSLYRLESGAPDLVKVGELGSTIRASLVPVGYDTFLAAGENGTIFKVEARSGEFRSYPMVDFPSSPHSGLASISAAPLIVGKLAYVGFARDTYYDSPAIACVDYDQEKIVWMAPAADASLGNVRTTPVFIDEVLVVASAYSDSAQLLDPASGKLMGQVVVGQSVFQQWSAPVVIGPHHIALGRVDGVCSIVDVRQRRLVTSISLATAETERLSLENQQYGDEAFALLPGQPAPDGAICATPGFDGRRLLVGTTDGRLAAIAIDLTSIVRLH